MPNDRKEPWEVKDDPDALIELFRDYALEAVEPGSTELSEEGIDQDDLCHGMAYMFACLDKLLENGHFPKRWIRQLKVSVNTDGSVTCLRCGKAHHPESTPNYGEEGGYLTNFQPEDRIFCECGAGLEVK